MLFGLFALNGCFLFAKQIMSCMYSLKAIEKSVDCSYHSHSFIAQTFKNLTIIFSFSIKCHVSPAKKARLVPKAVESSKWAKDHPCLYCNYMYIMTKHLCCTYWCNNNNVSTLYLHCSCKNAFTQLWSNLLWILSADCSKVFQVFYMLLTLQKYWLVEFTYLTVKIRSKKYQ